jgi:hypothetical protein
LAIGLALASLLQIGSASAQKLGAAQVDEPHKIAVASECTVVGKKFFVFAKLDVTWKESSDPSRQGIVPAQYRTGDTQMLWYVDCDLTSDSCVGFTFDLKKAGSGAPVHSTAGAVMIGARVIAKRYPSYVIQWGNNLLIAELANGDVQLITEGILDQTGTGKCSAFYDPRDIHELQDEMRKRSLRR